MSDEVLLPPVVENLIFITQVRHGQRVSAVARVFLRKAGEDQAVRILAEVESAEVGTVRCLSALIVYKVKKSLSASPPSLLSCGDANPSSHEENWPSPTGNVKAMEQCGPGISDGVSDETLLAMESAGRGFSEGLSDATLLAIDIPRTSPLSTSLEGSVTAAAGDCRSWGERPTSSPVPLVASQGSNDSVECGSAPFPCQGETLCQLEPDTFVSTPSSHVAEPSSSLKRRASGSADDGSSGSRSVKTKHVEQKILPQFYNQSKCRISEFADARKLDFGVEPIFSDPQSSQVIDPPRLQPKECNFRHRECALKRSELADPEVAKVFGELCFTKRFLVLDHCKGLQDFPPVEELEALKSLEVEDVDNRLYHRFPHPDHLAMRDWSKRGSGSLVFTCNVSHSGRCEFTGPRFENGGTPLQRAFGEENVLVVKFEDTTKNNHTILDRYRCLARHGILCGLKKFFFYAFKDAESKKKQGVSKRNTYGCKCVFVAIQSYATADIMQKFETIAQARNYLMHPTVPVLAKAISRLQLAFSQTTQLLLDFEKVHVEPIDDIPCKDEKGNVVHDADGKILVHTDGCGYISKNLAKLCQDVVIKGVKLLKKSDLKEKQEYPLMMQVRLFWKGNLWKGVLVVNLKLPDNTIQVRPSMLKVERDDNLFSATFNSLELCNTSRKPSDAKLFQHLILLLTQGGVKEETLLNYVETSIEKLKEYFTGSKKALDVATKCMDFHQCGVLACEMLLSGLEPSQEPFLQKVISEMVKSDLKNYSSGKVPVPDAAYLMGCADPTGLLERNQVAILVGNGMRICREKVLVYKPPGLHPGDVRVFEATWIKELEGYVGTGTYGIIFSVKGARSVTDEMAGSDLDGDQYWVSWNPELVDSFNPSPPWEAPNVVEEKKPMLRPVAEDEFETLHFEKFIQTRFDPSMVKGRAANTWLALTDCSMSGNVDKQTQRHAKEHISTLVNLFYKSLDAEKSGKEVRWPHQVQVNLFPHYLEKNKDEAAQDPNKLQSAPNRVHASGRKPAKEYPSTSILGKIYDLVKKEDLNKPIEVDIDKAYELEGYEEYYDDWCRRFADYKHRTITALNAVKLKSPNDQELRNCVADKLLAQYKEIFLGVGKPKKQLLKEASAIYTAVYGKAVIKESHALQFAWKIAGSQLCKIRAKKGQGYICLARENLQAFLRR